MPRRIFGIHTVPGRIRTLAGLALLALTGLVAGTVVAGWEAHDGLRAIGRGEGPIVIASSRLYLALSDMDAQVTATLLTGQEADWLCASERIGLDRLGVRTAVGTEAQVGTEVGRHGDESCQQPETRLIYEIRREDAQDAAMRAARLDSGDPLRLATAQAVLDGLTRYDQQVQATMQAATDQTTGSPPASFALGRRLPKVVLDSYRVATELMTDDLLPKAYNLTLAGGATVNSIYQARRRATLWGTTAVAATGLAAALALTGLQIYLATRFRRLFNPWLVLATLGTIALTVASAALLSAEADDLQVAKTDGFDSVLTLSRVRATGKTLDTDRSRALLDPQESDRYDEMYLDKSQTVLYLPRARNLDQYYANLDELLDRRGGDGHAGNFEGFHGAEAARATGPEREPLDTLLSAYRRYQDHDHHVRHLAAAGDVEGAARAQVDIASIQPDGTASYLPHPSFLALDEGLAALISRHQYTIDLNMLGGGWAAAAGPLLVSGSVVVIAALVVAGVRPRLTEYR